MKTAAANGQKVLVNLGSGPKSAFRGIGGRRGWREIRVDIDPSSKPEIVASLTNLRDHVADRSADVVFSSHAVEHLRDNDVDHAFKEMARILKLGGFALLTCPDVSLVAKEIVDGQLDKVLYTSPSGPITALDILYGHRPSIRSGQDHMQHKTGFSQASIAKRLLRNGFKEVRVASGAFYDLWALAFFEEPESFSILGDLTNTPMDFGLVHNAA